MQKSFHALTLKMVSQILAGEQRNRGTGGTGEKGKRGKGGRGERGRGEKGRGEKGKREKTRGTSNVFALPLSLFPFYPLPPFFR